MTRLLFIGSKPLGLRIAQTLHSVCPDALTGVAILDDRGDSRSAYDAVTQWASDAGLPFWSVQTARDLQPIIGRIQPDLALVCGWYRMLPSSVRNSFPRGMLGIHNSVLPAYRGGAPVVWAMLHGEPEVGVSLFTLTDGIDEGPLWAQARVPVGREAHIHDVLADLETKTVEMVADALPAILSGTLQPTPQPSVGVSYAAQRYPWSGLIDWHLPAESIARSIRAQSEPYPGAFAYAGEHRVVIWRATPCPERHDGHAGQVVRLTDTAVIVACGQRTALALHEVTWKEIRQPARAAIRTVQLVFTPAPTQSHTSI